MWLAASPDMAVMADFCPTWLKANLHIASSLWLKTPHRRLLQSIGSATAVKASAPQPRSKRLLFCQSFVGARSNFNFIAINDNISRNTITFVTMSGSDLIMIP
jgi:hypothetical protein